MPRRTPGIRRRTMTMVQAAQSENQDKISTAANVSPECSAQKQSSHRVTMTASPGSGEGGIRTPGTLRYAGFQDQSIRPLWHLSKYCRRRVLPISDMAIQVVWPHLTRAAAIVVGEPLRATAGVCDALVLRFCRAPASFKRSLETCACPQSTELDSTTGST